MHAFFVLYLGQVVNKLALGQVALDRTTKGAAVGARAGLSVLGDVEVDGFAEAGCCVVGRSDDGRGIVVGEREVGRADGDFADGAGLEVGACEVGACEVGILAATKTDGVGE